MFDSTELLKLAGAEAGAASGRVRLKRSWARPLALLTLDLVWAVLLAAILYAPGFLRPIRHLNFIGLSFIGIVALLGVVFVVAYFVWTRYDLTTEMLEVDPGGQMCRWVALAEVAAVERYGWFVRLATGGRVRHLRLKLKADGGVVRLKDLRGAELVEHCILVRWDKLLAGASVR